MRGLVMWVVIGVGAVGCTQSPAARAEIVCSTFCDCVVGTALPDAVQSCVDNQCLPQLPPVSDACLACVYSHEQTCSGLQTDCLQLCLQMPVPALIGGPP